MLELNRARVVGKVDGEKLKDRMDKKGFRNVRLLLAERDGRKLPQHEFKKIITVNRKLVVAAAENKISELRKILSEHDGVKGVVSDGVDIDTADDHGNTALMYASLNGHRKVVKLLLDNGASVKPQNTDGGTCLILALLGGHSEIAKTLMDAGANVHAEDNNGWSVLECAEEKGLTEVAGLLKERSAKY